MSLVGGWVSKGSSLYSCTAETAVVWLRHDSLVSMGTYLTVLRCFTLGHYITHTKGPQLFWYEAVPRALTILVRYLVQETNEQTYHPVWNCYTGKAWTKLEAARLFLQFGAQLWSQYQVPAEL